MPYRKREQQTQSPADPPQDITPSSVSTVDTLQELVGEIEASKPRASDNVESLLEGERDTSGDLPPNTSVPYSESPSGFVDPNHFDPSIHSVGADGKPRLNKDGTFRRKRGKGKATQKVVATPVAVSPEDIAKAKQAAFITVQSLLVIATSLGGEEWVADASETKMMVDSWEQYYIMTGAFDMPPWVMVLVSTGMYAAPRFRLPKTQTKLAALWGWISFKFGWE
jgi:hypothetical protein